MPANANVIVKYGPYDQNGIVQHATHRLEGLQKVLQEQGHKTTLEQIEDWNSMKIFVNGETVFNCDIRDLDFGGDGKLDPLVQEAAQKVKQAF